MRASEFQPVTFDFPGITGVIAASRRRLARHTHDEYGIGVIERGAHRSASGRGMVEAGPGQIITVNPEEVHDGAPVGDSPRHWRMLYFDVALVQQSWVQIGASGARMFEFDRPALKDDLAARLLQKLFTQLATGGKDGQALAEEHLLLLLSRLGSSKIPNEAASLQREVQLCRQRIADDPAAAPSLAELARWCGLSRFQILRAFASTTGLTPHAYIMQQRMRQARELIRQRMPLAVVAAECGFADQSHLSRVFVRSHGYTPGAYARAFA